MPSHSHLVYRADIDGLRAIAVLAVLIFHAFPVVLPGGFIGVDVFFVISGYLISSIIMKSADEGRFSIADFYARRIRRIVPPLLAMIVSVMVIGWSVLLPDEYAQLAKHALAGIGFVSNIVLWQESGYFDSAAHLKPFLHLWSLGVEEQFYIVWPLILIMVLRKGLPFLSAAALLFALSFAANIAMTSTSGSAGYFLLPGRAWEMLAGAMLAWRLRYHGELFAAGGRLANGAGLLGLLLIVLALFVIDKNRAFPGWWAILPVLGTVLLIAAGEKSITSRLVLSRKSMVAVGLISFPLYLWHWPLLSLVWILHGEEASASLLAGILLLAALFAALSYHLIEKPVRRRTGLRSVMAVLGVTVVVAGLSINIYSRDGLNFRLKDAQAAAEAKALEWGEEMRASDSCRVQIGEGIELGCLIADPQRQAGAVIIGDSHANHYYWGLSSILGEQGINLMQFSRGACSPLHGVIILKGVQTIDCKSFINPLVDYIAESPDIHTVFLGGRWMAYITGRELKDPPDYANDERLVLPDEPLARGLPRAEIFARGLDETLRRLLAKGKRVVFLHAVPELPFNARECVSWTPNRFVSRVPRPSCDVERTLVDARADEYWPVLEKILQRYPQVVQLDPQQFLCDGQRCSGKADGVLLYRDDDHLSLGGTQWLAQRLKPGLLEALDVH